MCTFIQQTLEPAIFWNALAAISTSFAVLVALFLPVYQKYKRTRMIDRLVNAEIIRNGKMAKNAVGPQTVPFPGGKTQEVILEQDEFLRLLDTKLWQEYKYKLADKSPEKYKKYQDVYQYIDAIATLDKVSEKIREIMFRDNVSSFVEKCKKL